MPQNVSQSNPSSRRDRRQYPIGRFSQISQIAATVARCLEKCRKGSPEIEFEFDDLVSSVEYQTVGPTGTDSDDDRWFNVYPIVGSRMDLLSSQDFQIVCRSEQPHFRAAERDTRDGLLELCKAGLITISRGGFALDGRFIEPDVILQWPVGGIDQ